VSKGKEQSGGLKGKLLISFIYSFSSTSFYMNTE